VPDSAPTGRLAPWVYDEAAARVALDALEALLAARDELSERDDILPFLRAHPHLCALIGSYNRRANVYDRLGLEAPLFGQFTADLVSGDGAARAYTLVECEDGRPGSLFAQRARQRTEWSPRCEHGLSQLTDWLWLLDDQKHTHIVEAIFGARPITATVVLVIGRDSGLAPTTIHLLVPRGRRWVGALPGVTAHTTTRDLAPTEIVTRQGLRMTAPMHTILDVADSGTAPEQVIMAVGQARERGMIIAGRLRREAERRDRRVRGLIDRALERAGW